MTTPHQASLWRDWRSLAQAALKGAPLESLSTRAGGLDLLPLYAPAAPSTLGRPRHGPWQRIARVDAAGVAAAGELAGGSDGLALVFPAAASASGGGFPARTVDALDAALEGVMLDGIALHLEAGRDGAAALALICALAERRGTPPAALHAGLGSAAPGQDAGAAPGDAVRGFVALGVPGTALLADGRVVAEAGGTPVTELAYALHAVVEMLRALDGDGLSPATVLPLTAMALCATHDQFATIAKLRAARRLHRLLADACGVDTPLALHATTARRMLSRSDPETNILRLAIATFAAGVGGADAVVVLPFDPAGSPFGRRVARNINNLLVEEAHLGRLDDPGAGAGAIEAYTDALAEAAWALFQAMERDPGYVVDGRLARRVADECQAAEAATRAGASPIVGVTIHPPSRPPRPAAAAPAASERSAPASDASVAAPLTPAADAPAPSATSAADAPAQAPTAATTSFAELLAAARAGASVGGTTSAASAAPPLLAPQRAASPFGG